MDIGARCVQASYMVGRRLCSQGLTETLHQFLVPGSANDGLGGEAYALQITGQAVDAGRAIQFCRGRLANAFHCRS